MKKGKVLLLLLVIVVVFSSCSTIRSGKTNDNGIAIPIKEKEVEIIGNVQAEYTAFGIIGVTPELSLLSWGDRSSYVSLLEKAKKLGADEVINIKTDMITSHTFVLFNSSTWIATGLAVKYVD
ncbi:MAG: hypothetical protein EOM68_07750 [Spirochaetia bacterium]|jgi:hypothetical protein|nr:hypothetical protein [Spirochaetia bacterium]